MNSIETRLIDQSPAPLLAPHHGNSLNLHHQAGPRKAAHCDERTTGEALLEDFLPDLYELVSQPRVADEYRHSHHVREPLAAHFLDGLVEVREHVAHLSLEIRRWIGSGAPRKPNRLATFGNDGPRECAFLGTRIRRVTLLRLSSGHE